MKLRFITTEGDYYDLEVDKKKMLEKMQKASGHSFYYLSTLPEEDFVDLYKELFLPK